MILYFSKHQSLSNVWSASKLNGKLLLLKLRHSKRPCIRLRHSRFHLEPKVPFHGLTGLNEAFRRVHGSQRFPNHVISLGNGED